MQQSQKRWYQDKSRVYAGLARSSWVTSATDWFMSFAGKSVEIILYATVLYSCAQLYPGVHLPESLSLTIFLVQMGALDIGGLSLGKLAKQAHEDGNKHGAKHARRLSIGLIAIMLVGVATVGIERVIPLPSQVQIGVQLVLVIARSVGSVLYGRVVHDLKPVDGQVQQVNVADFTERLTEIEQGISHQVTEKFQLLERTLTEHLERVGSEQKTVIDLTPVHKTLQEHTRALVEIAALPALLEKHLKQAVQEIKEANATRPRLSLVGQFSPETEHSVKASESEPDKGAFVRACLTEHPEMRNSDIQRAASEQGITISPAHISQIRKAFEERTA